MIIWRSNLNVEERKKEEREKNLLCYRGSKCKNPQVEKNLSRLWVIERMSVILECNE